MNGVEKLWQKYSNGIWECSQAIQDKKDPRDTKCCFGLLHKCSQSHLYFGTHIWNIIIIESAYILPSDSKKYMCEVCKLSIYLFTHSLNKCYVHAVYETLKKQILIICVPLPQKYFNSYGIYRKVHRHLQCRLNPVLKDYFFQMYLHVFLYFCLICFESVLIELWAAGVNLNDEYCHSREYLSGGKLSWKIFAVLLWTFYSNSEVSCITDNMVSQNKTIDSYIWEKIQGLIH